MPAEAPQAHNPDLEAPRPAPQLPRTAWGAAAGQSSGSMTAQPPPSSPGFPGRVRAAAQVAAAPRPSWTASQSPERVRVLRLTAEESFEQFSRQLDRRTLTRVRSFRTSLEMSRSPQPWEGSSSLSQVVPSTDPLTECKEEVLVTGTYSLPPWTVAACMIGVTLVTVAVITVAKNQTPDGCSTNERLHCPCERLADMAWVWAAFFFFSLGYTYTLGSVVVRVVTGDRSHFWPLAFTFATAVASCGVQIFLMDAGSSSAEAFIWSKVVELGAAWLLARVICPVPALRHRARPMYLFIAAYFLTSVLVALVATALVQIESVADEVLVLYPICISLQEAAIVKLLKKPCETWPALEISMLARLFVSALEGQRIGMLLVSVDRGITTFALALALTVPLEIVNRNDLWWTGLRKLRGWTDEEVNAKFSQVKEMFLCSRFDAEYSPTFALVVAVLFGTIGSQVAMHCDGELLDEFTPGWAYVTAVLLAEAVSDVATVLVRRALARRRPLLARNLQVERPVDRLRMMAVTQGCFFGGSLGLAAASLVLTAHAD